MKLFEHQGKELFQKYGIATPKGVLISRGTIELPLSLPFMLKSQVLTGNRKAKGGIVLVEKEEDFETVKSGLFGTAIDGSFPEQLLAEEVIKPQEEFYVSFSYDSQARGPVLMLSLDGGSGVENAAIAPVDLSIGLPDFFIREALLKAGMPLHGALVKVIKSLWNLFSVEQVLVAEINPLFRVTDEIYIAGDAKVVQDDSIVNPGFRPYLELGGDIAVLASGGGASLINLDALIHFGGKPANYVEYSGNPPASVVDELTRRVFAKPGLKGAWVVGGTANFTDIYETMLGFVEGLKKIQPKPAYPIVIRRDGPRQKEAFEMLRQVAEKEGYDFHLFGPETPMSESAKKIVELAYNKNKSA